jgi:hypothetical protein
MKKFRYPETRRRAFILSVLFIGMVSLVQPGCDCSSSSGTPSQPAISSEFPPPNSETALVSTIVSAVFRDDMDASTINTTTFTLTLGATTIDADVVYDASTRTATLTPQTDLTPDIEYRATISVDVKNINGSYPLTTANVWSFTTSPSISLVSENSSGVTSNNVSQIADINDSGRYIVFESSATNLTTAVTISTVVPQIYRKDTLTGEVSLVSVDSTGLVAANNASFNPRISSGGRFVVFESRATNLDQSVATFGIKQIYIKDMQDGSIEIASRDVNNAPDNSLNTAANARVSTDGSFVVFESADPDLSPTTGNTFTQIYLKNMSDGSVDMISQTTSGEAGFATSGNPDMSSDGTHIVFESLANNLTGSGFRQIMYKDTTSTGLGKICINTAGFDATSPCFNPSISDDGQLVVFELNQNGFEGNDSNGSSDIYIRQAQTGPTALVSLDSSGTNSPGGVSTDANISSNGKYIVFKSTATDILPPPGTSNVGHIYVRDATTALYDVVRVNNPESGSEATAASDNPVISGDGRYVAFDSVEQFTLTDDIGLRDVFRAHNSTYQQ